jgi:hypothetical protein
MSTKEERNKRIELYLDKFNIETMGGSALMKFLTEHKDVGCVISSERIEVDFNYRKWQYKLKGK